MRNSFMNSLRSIFVTAFFAVAVFSFPALAQTTPTFGENSIGVTCSKLSKSADFDTIAQCNNATDASGTMQKAPLFLGAVTAPPYAAVTCDADKKGMMQYDGTDMQFCDGSAWQVMPTKAYVDAAGGGTWNSETFTAGGTWTKPAGVTEVNLLLVGGGGGGGGGSSGDYSSGGGGEGGCVVNYNNLPVSANLTVTIGAAGSAVAYNKGGNGGSTTVSGGLYPVTSAGGLGGDKSYYILYNSAYTYYGGDGGGHGGEGGKYENYDVSSGVNMYLRIKAKDGITGACAGGGGGGGANTLAASLGGNGGSNIYSSYSGGTGGAIGNPFAGGGGGGGGYGGNGGAGGYSSHYAGYAGTGYGAGGGGGLFSGAGGAGYAGYAIIYWQE